jgi:hypothetical protein
VPALQVQSHDLKTSVPPKRKKKEKKKNMALT